MAEEGQQPGTESLGWRAGLPDDLKTNEIFTPYKTVGDFAKSHIETAAKLKDVEGKLGNSIPKLGENATPEERNQFFNSLGRPEKPEGYELTKDSKNASEWDKYWENELFKNGVPKDMAHNLKKSMDGQIHSMVEQHNAKIQADITEASAKLKTEWGDKYDGNLELVKRFWKKETDSDFEAAFTGETSANRFTMMRFLFKMAAKTGEDTSLRSADERQAAPKDGYDLSVFKLPPARV